VAQRQEQVERDLLDLLRRRFNEGVSPERDLHQTEAALESVRAAVPPLTTGLEAQFNRLDVLMGAQPGTYRSELIAPAPVPSPPAFADRATPADLLSRRPDLVAAQARLHAANARIGAAMSDYYPKVSLQALLGVDSLAASRLFHADAEQSQFGAGLRWRLFDFGRIDAEVAAARGARAEALAAYRQSVFLVAEEVENSLSRLTDEQRRAAFLQRQIADLTIARRQAVDAYQGGVTSLIDVRDADRDLLIASDQLVQANAGAARGAVAFYRALGGS
jgi:outer membrane protein TolC